MLIAEAAVVVVIVIVMVACCQSGDRANSLEAKPGVRGRDKTGTMTRQGQDRGSKRPRVRPN